MAAVLTSHFLPRQPPVTRLFWPILFPRAGARAREWAERTGLASMLGFEEGSGEDGTLADQVICFVGNELIEGQSYWLLLDKDGPCSGGQSRARFAYSRKHWPLGR